MDMAQNQVVTIGAALGCPLRLAVLSVLGEEGRTPSDAARALGITRSVAHYHLRRLVEAQLAERRGRRRGCRYAWPAQRWELVLTDYGPSADAPGR